MTRGRPPVCPFCKSTASAKKGVRRTQTLGVRQIRKCKKCGRRFTPRSQGRVAKPSVTHENVDFNPPTCPMQSGFCPG